jgi:DNA-binding NarL/FixJ family response regulator
MARWPFLQMRASYLLRDDMIDTDGIYQYSATECTQFQAKEMRIFIADSDQETRLGLHMRLNLEPGMLIVGLAVRAESLLAQLAGSEADALILDWQLPGLPITDVIAQIKAADHAPQIVVLANQSEAKRAAIAAGADVFFAKTWPIDRLLSILERLSVTT